MLLRGLLLALVLAGGLRFAFELREHYSFVPRSGGYTDLRIFLSQVTLYERDGELYDTERSGYFDPGSAVYKYPPPWAAALKPLATVRFPAAIKILATASLLILLAALAVLLGAARAARERALLATAVFLLWRPFSESLMGMQIEPLLLLALSISFAFLARAPGVAAGFFVGVAGAFKVYPGVLTLWGVPRRSALRFVAGAAAGAVATIGAASLVLGSAAPAVRYFTEVLPGLGGTILRWDNLSLTAWIGRGGVYALHGAEGLGAAMVPDRETLGAPVLEAPGREVVRALALAGTAAAAAVMIAITARAEAARRRLEAPADAVARGQASGHPTPEHSTLQPSTSQAPPPPPQAARLGFAAAICLLLVLMPTSWADYQTLLAIPMTAAIAWAAPPRQDPWTWALILATAVAGIVPLPDAFYEAHPAGASAARAWMPVALCWACVRILRTPTAGLRGCRSSG